MNYETIILFIFAISATIWPVIGFAHEHSDKAVDALYYPAQNRNCANCSIFNICA